MDGAFAGRFGDEDWAHALGGLHVLATVDGELAGHAAVVGRQLIAGGGRCAPGTWRRSPRRPGCGAAARGPP
jgi:hypothetical protein